MLSLHNISLVQFRNYENVHFSFPKRITGIAGKNGSGKTNLLDAVYYLCFTKSYFGKTDLQNAQYGKKGFRVGGTFRLAETSSETVCIVRETGKKEFTLNNAAYGRMAEHIGKFPCVMIAPDDIAIITEGSEERRKFIDYTISQMDAAYLQTLIDYNKILQQRNSLLKLQADTGKMDEALFQVFSDQLVQAGNIIFKKRTDFLDGFIPVAVALYNDISGHREQLGIRYASPLQKGEFGELLRQNKSRDILLQRTTQGVHRDDLEFDLEKIVFKTGASQGQRKSLLFALKLAEFEMLLKDKGFAPILLLDDVFEKLDEERMFNLLNRVCVANQGQVFISDTHYERLNESLKNLSEDHEVIRL
ncbi:MAG: DNA replication and repair protein RecF [Chitinophagaceae bacterium]|nr:DNA replication and repair protein RecF [Chitinophagaceae bacterium]MCW5929023.1 DNA replication and repair protein RecF [Chitinophagaceae bacterium]